MKKLFLTASFADVSKRLPKFLGEDCEGNSVTFILTASTTEEVRFYVEAAKTAFSKLGVTVDELDVAQASKKEITSKLIDNDYIYVSGGNTFYLLQELKRTGADEIIRDQLSKGKVYIGESAGSMILSPDITYVKLMDDTSKATSLKNYTALGVVDFYPVPHHTDFPFKEIVEEIIAVYDSTLRLYPISNKQMISVKGSIVEVLSE